MKCPDCKKELIKSQPSCIYYCKNCDAVWDMDMMRYPKDGYAYCLAKFHIAWAEFASETTNSLQELLDAWTQWIDKIRSKES